MAFGHLSGLIPPRPVDSLTTDYGWPIGDYLGPALHVCVFMCRDKLGSRVQVSSHQLAIPGPNRNIGDGVLVAC